ncbi:MAG TPA: acyl-CoA desaturase [Tepidisphaeraceae bacterium]|nr:acyl-CoA desaturase [Tepidisphaeraceae bacterium]
MLTIATASHPAETLAPDASFADASAVGLLDEPQASPPASEPQRPAAPPDKLISPVSRMIDLSAIIIPFLIFLTIGLLLWGRGLNGVQLGVMFAMYLLTGFGVTVGYHRLFTHKAFETPKFMRITLAVLGSMSVQGPLLWWVAMHRRHHHHSDADGDPHSPHLHGESLKSLIAGAWHSHAGWLFKPDAPNATRYVVDLIKEKPLKLISELYPLWAALSLLIPAAISGLLLRSWTGAAWGLLWGGVLRVFFVHHITWSVNSVCHLWGSRPFVSHDQSRNNALFGILALGEGWHNNHHAFPTSARHGLQWWQIDTTWWVIRCMAALGLASRVRVPAERAMEAKMAR